MSSVSDTVVGYASLWEVVCADFRTAVARRYEALAAVCDIINILLMLSVVDECIESAQGALLVLRLVAGLCTFDEDFLHVELKARFDEENNIGWSRRLEDAGCHVIYGIDNLKVHSKLCLITRKSKKGIEYITQIGTGNYNEKTARLYTDLQILTSNSEIGMEANQVFSALSFGEVVEETNHLMVAPKCLQNKVIALIDDEIEKARTGREAYIGLKLNSLTDKKIIDKLIEASNAGVKIDMVIRGICCLQSGIPGYTDNIRIISIVGRFLEHSRIYIFGKGEEEKMYISSADFMTRNTLRRVEVAAPIYDEKIKHRLNHFFNTMLIDNCKARVQCANGEYEKVVNEFPKTNSQELFYEEAYNNVESIKEEKETRNQEVSL